MRNRGSAGVGSVRKSSETLQQAQIGSLHVKHHRIRQFISERIGRLDLNSDVIGILRAITVADKAGIDHQLWLLFQQFGVNHLLVISGLHVGMIAGLRLPTRWIFAALFVANGFFPRGPAGGFCSPFSLYIQCFGGIFIAYPARALHAELFCNCQLAGAQKWGI